VGFDFSPLCCHYHVPTIRNLGSGRSYSPGNARSPPHAANATAKARSSFGPSRHNSAIWSGQTSLRGGDWRRLKKLQHSLENLRGQRLRPNVTSVKRC
jgi:hypothetical protein